MSRYVAYSPNGQAYQCDTLAEVRRVEGKRKKRNGSCGCKKNPGKRRNGDCGCQKNPRRRRNPSEDYSLGVFQGAMEHGKLPPPKTASADYRKGYAAGSKAGRSKPEARAQALGVFKASGSQRQGGETLQELVAGTSTVQNPRSKKRNPSVFFVTLPDGRVVTEVSPVAVQHWTARGGKARRAKASEIAALAESRLQESLSASRQGDKVAAKDYATAAMGYAKEVKGAGPNEILRKDLIARIQPVLDATRSAFRNPRKRRNPQVSGQAVHDAYFRLAKVYLPGQSLPVYTGKVTLLDLARELRVSPEDISFNGTGLYNLNGRIYEMLAGEDLALLQKHSAKKRNPSLLTIGLVAGAAYAYTKSAGVRKHTKAAGKGLATGARAAYGAYKHHAKKGNPAPTSAAARKHLAHEKSEEATFATMLDKLPVGVTLKAGKHRIRKLSRGYVVVDGVRLTDKEAAKKIHRG